MPLAYSLLHAVFPPLSHLSAPPFKDKRCCYVQVFEIFMHILGACDDMVVEYGCDLLKAAITGLHVHAKSVPLAELQKLGLSTVRSDIHLSLAMMHQSCVLMLCAGLSP